MPDVGARLWFGGHAELRMKTVRGGRETLKRTRVPRCNAVLEPPEQQLL